MYNMHMLYFPGHKRKCRSDAIKKVDYSSNNYWEDVDPEGFEIQMIEGKGR